MASFLDGTGLGHLIEKIKAAFIAKSDTTAATSISIDSAPTANSTNLVTSGGVKTALDAKQNTIDSSHKLSADLISDGTTNKAYTATEKTKLSGIASGAEVNVQSDWNQTTTTADDYIKNKPTIPDSVSDLTQDVNYAGSASVGGAALKTGSIPFGVVDSTSTATVFTATVSGITALTDGTCVLLKNGVITSASGFTLNINGLGAHPAFSNMTAATAETTIFNINYTMLFVYDSTRVVGGVTGAWCCYRGYDANTNTIGYQLRGNNGTRTVTDRARYYKIYFSSADGQQWVPASSNWANDATAAKAVNQTPIDPFGPIVYTSANTSYTAGSVLAATTIWQQYTVTLGHSFNVSGGALTLTTNAPVYVKCAPQSNGSAIMDSTTPIVQALPSTEDGKIYIFLGFAYSATAIELRMEHPVYYYKDSAIRLWTNAAASSSGTVGTLNTSNTTAQTASSSESFSGTINLHKVSKTGSYNDLLNKPTIPTGIPSGGSAGQVLAKSSGTDYDVAWTTDSGGGSTKEDKMEIVTITGTTLSAALNKYYTGTSVGTLAVTLPYPGDNYVHSIVFFLSLGSSPNVTFTASNNYTIAYQSGYELEADKTYEINALFNGIAWVIVATEIDMPAGGGGGEF